MKEEKNKFDLIKEGKLVAKNIVLCEDKKFRWIYEMNLFKTPIIFTLVYLIFFFILLASFAAASIATLFSGESFASLLKGYGIALIAVTVIVCLSYLIYALIMGGKYIVLFEMDEKGINSTQIDSQAKKVKSLASATILAGILSGSISTIAIGLNAQRASMYTSFFDVTSIKENKRLEVLKLREGLRSNHVYVDKEDFGFVSDFIKSHLK